MHRSRGRAPSDCQHDVVLCVCVCVCVCVCACVCLSVRAPRWCAVVIPYVRVEASRRRGTEVWVVSVIKDRGSRRPKDGSAAEATLVCVTLSLSLSCVRVRNLEGGAGSGAAPAHACATHTDTHPVARAAAPLDGRRPRTLVPEPCMPPAAGCAGAGATRVRRRARMVCLHITAATMHGRAARRQVLAEW